jgi:hypothetical protein
MEQLKNKNHLTPGLSDVLATRATLDMARTTRLAVKMAIPEPPVLGMVMMVAVVMTLTMVMTVTGMTTES